VLSFKKGNNDIWHKELSAYLAAEVLKILKTEPYNRHMKNIEILNQELLSDRKYPLKDITYNKPDLHGNLHQQKSEVYFRPDAVAVLLVDLDKKVFLLTRQFRMPTYLNGNKSGYILEACAGLIDEGESPEETAKREVKEETGYSIDDLNKVGAIYTSGGGITEYLHLFIARLDSAGPHEDGGGLEEEGENIEIVTVSFQQAEEELRNGKINDAKTLMLLQHYFMYNGITKSQLDLEK
jgi:GDP-mannose pyrophosphatase NudK